MLSSVAVDFVHAFDLVASFLEGRGFPVALIGGFGLHAYGITRATFDLDLVTEAAAQDALISFLEAKGYETLHRSVGFSNQRGAQDLVEALASDLRFAPERFVDMRGNTSHGVLNRRRSRRTPASASCHRGRPGGPFRMLTHACTISIGCLHDNATKHQGHQGSRRRNPAAVEKNDGEHPLVSIATLQMLDLAPGARAEIRALLPPPA